MLTCLPLFLGRSCVVCCGKQGCNSTAIIGIKHPRNCIPKTMDILRQYVVGLIPAMTMNMTPDSIAFKIHKAVYMRSASTRSQTKFRYKMQIQQHTSMVKLCSNRYIRKRMWKDNKQAYSALRVKALLLFRWDIIDSHEGYLIIGSHLHCNICCKLLEVRILRNEVLMTSPKTHARPQEYQARIARWGNILQSANILLIVNTIQKKRMNILGKSMQYNIIQQLKRLKSSNYRDTVSLLTSTSTAILLLKCT